METNIDPATGIIVKSDQTGRIRYTPEYKRKVLADFESSSLSATVFAKQCGIKYPTLAAWIGMQKRVIKQHREGTLRLSSLPRLPLPPTDRRWKFNYSGAVVRASDVEQTRLLPALARDHLGLDPLNGAAFLFTNKYPASSRSSTSMELDIGSSQNVLKKAISVGRRISKVTAASLCARGMTTSPTGCSHFINSPPSPASSTSRRNSKKPATSVHASLPASFF